MLLPSYFEKALNCHIPLLASHTVLLYSWQSPSSWQNVVSLSGGIEMEGQKQLMIFLSHASQDKPKVRNLCKRLKQDGFDPWLDEERLLPGQDWNLEIEKALRASDAILLCFSALSVAKEGYIQREYKRAMKYLEEKPLQTRSRMLFRRRCRTAPCHLPHSVTPAFYWRAPALIDIAAFCLLGSGL
jgi:TIR domain-containing protein